MSWLSNKLDGKRCANNVSIIELQLSSLWDFECAKLMEIVKIVKIVQKPRKCIRYIINNLHSTYLAEHNKSDRWFFIFQ